MFIVFVWQNEVYLQSNPSNSFHYELHSWLILSVDSGIFETDMVKTHFSQMFLTISSTFNCLVGQ